MADESSPAELRKAAETRSLTAAEKVIAYGAGNLATIMYAERNGTVVMRRFMPGDEIGPEWKDSPTACGAPETHPGFSEQVANQTEEVFGYTGPMTPAPVLTDADLAAAHRKPRMQAKSGKQTDFGDQDD